VIRMVFQIASMPWGPSEMQAVDWIAMGVLSLAFLFFGVMAARLTHRAGRR